MKRYTWRRLDVTEDPGKAKVTSEQRQDTTARTKSNPKGIISFLSLSCQTPIAVNAIIHATLDNTASQWRYHPTKALCEYKRAPGFLARASQLGQFSVSRCADHDAT
jgi:hypothetical protein